MAGLLENMYRYASRPVRDLVELGNITKTGLGVKRAQSPVYSKEELLQFANNGGSQAFLGGSKNQQYQKDLKKSQQAYDKVTNYKPVALKQDEMEGLLGYDRAFKDAAIVGSFMMPGIGSGLGGALGSGAIAGAMGGYGGSKKGEEVQSTLTGAGFGAAGGALGYGLGKLIGKMKVPKPNTKLVKEQASKLGKTPQEFTESSGKLLQDMIDGGYDVSSPTKIANNYPKFLKSLQDDVATNSLTAEGIPDISELRNIYMDGIQDITGKSALTNRLTRISKDFFDNPEPTYGDVVNYKMAIDELGGGVESVQKSGKNITAQLMRKLRDESRSMASNVPELDNALLSFKNAMDFKKTILKNPEIATNLGLYFVLGNTKANIRPIVDTLRPSTLGQRVASGPIGKLGEAVGKGLSGPGDPALRAGIQGFKPSLNLTGAITGSSALGAGSSGMQEQSQDMGQGAIPGGDMADYIDPATGMLRDLGGGQGMGESGGGQGLSVQQALSQAMQMIPNGSESEIMSLAKMLMAEGGEATTTAAGKQAEADAVAALDQLGRMEQSVDSQSELFGPIRGTIAGTTPLGGIETKSLNAEIFLAKQIIGKFLEGGVLRKEDEDKYRKILPLTTDQLPVAKAKLAALKEELTNRLERYRQSGYAGYGTEGGSSTSQDYDSWQY